MPFEAINGRYYVWGTRRDGGSSAGAVNGVLWVLRTGAPWHDLRSQMATF